MKKIFTLSLLFFCILNLAAQTYCDTGGNNSSDEWIANIEIGSISIPSGDDSGYYYEADPISLSSGQSYNVNLVTGYADPTNPFTEHWRIWIDLDDDGVFSSSELLVDSGTGQEGSYSSTLSIPTSTNAVNTRMRVSMKWVGNYNDGTSDFDPPSACGTFAFGEVEDYALNLSASSGGGNDGNYCSLISSSSQEEWMASVEMNGNIFPTGNNNGYLDNTSNSIAVQLGNPVSFSLNPGFSDTSNPFDEYWRIWVDWNQNETFDASELWYDAGQGNDNTVSGTLTVPASALEGSTRMRIAMKWVGSYTDGSEDLTPPNACGTFPYGEVEDYTLVVSNDGSGGNGNAPVANFNANQTIGEAPFSVTYTDISTNNPTSWSWSFPGGSPSSSTNNNPTIVYSNPGVYNVTLTATNADGSDSETKNGYITVSDVAGAAPVADFIANFTSGQAPFAISFTDLSSNNPVTWNWTFPGGSPSVSNSSSPLVTYSTPGIYDVSLTVSNSAGGNTIVKSGYITVTEANGGVPIASFTSSVNMGQAPLTVTFFNQSQNGAFYQWSFPGAVPASSSEQNPTVTYMNPGLFDVSLTVTNTNGIEDSQTQNGFIFVEEPVGLNESSFELLEIFPNPVKDVLNIQFEETASFTQINIFDALGKLQFTSPFKNQISVQDLADGIYQVQIVGETESIIKTIIKK